MNVYCVSLPRSGTTLLGIILNQHSQCMYIGESYYWGQYKRGESKCSCGDVNCQVLDAVYAKINKDVLVQSFCDTCVKLDSNFFNKAAHKVCDDEMIMARQGLSILMDVYRKLNHKQIIIDTSSNISIGQKLLLSSDFKVILLTRDPRGVLFSFKKSSIRYKKSQQLSPYVESFILFAQRAIDIIDNSNVLWVRYEDFCSNPVSEFQRICYFLGLEYEPQMINLTSVSHHLVMGNRIRNLKALQIKEDVAWRTGLNIHEQEMLISNRRVVELYERLGYVF